MRPRLNHQSGLEILNEHDTFIEVREEFIENDPQAKTRRNTLRAQAGGAAREELAVLDEAIRALYHKVKMQFAAELRMQSQSQCKPLIVMIRGAHTPNRHVRDND